MKYILLSIMIGLMLFAAVQANQIGVERVQKYQEKQTEAINQIDNQ